MAGDPGVPHDAGVAEARERVEMRNAAERSDRADASLATQILQAEVGEMDFNQGRAVLQQYVAAMPADERAKLVNETLPDGRLALNDPQRILALANKAIGDLPSAPEGITAELEACRKRMREDPRGWHNDARAQIRYRRLVRARDGG